MGNYNLIVYAMILLVINMGIGYTQVWMTNEIVTDTSGEKYIEANILDSLKGTTSIGTTSANTYDSETSVGSTKEWSNWIVLKTLLKGLKPIPTPTSGYANQTELVIWWMVGLIRIVMGIITGFLVFLTLKNRQGQG